MPMPSLCLDNLLQQPICMFFDVPYPNDVNTPLVYLARTTRNSGCRSRSRGKKLKYARVYYGLGPQLASAIVVDRNLMYTSRKIRKKTGV